MPLIYVRYDPRVNSEYDLDELEDTIRDSVAKHLTCDDEHGQLTRDDMEDLGFYVCVTDLEDELVRALGSAAVLRIVEAEGELGPFRTFQKQPAKRELRLEEQLWRFMWNRKIRYAPLLVGALDLGSVPRPLDGVLAHL